MYNDFTTKVSLWGAKKLNYLKEDALIINQPISEDFYREFYVSVYMKNKKNEVKE